MIDWPTSENPYGVHFVAPEWMFHIPVPTQYEPIRLTRFVLHQPAVVREWATMPGFHLIDVFPESEACYAF